MILDRLIAYPESRRVFRLHLASAPLTALYWGVVGIIPVLLRKDFSATLWQVVIVTSAPAVMASFAVVWNEVYRRIRPGRFVLLLWLITHLPLAAIALCHRPLTMLVFYVIGCSGFGGLQVLTADVLRACYPPVCRNRVFGLVSAAMQLSIVFTSYAVGRWLDIDVQAFRIYLPIAVLLIGVGMYLLARITHEPLFQERQAWPPQTSLRTSLSRVYQNMVTILRKDPSFRQYESAFFGYGMGFMICTALMPFLAWDKLHLSYTAVARATQVTYQLTMLLMLIPAGYLLDRMGPVRMSRWAFSLLVLFPCALTVCTDEFTLTLSYILYAIGMTAVQLTWTMGPVSLAPDASQAPTYLAIHASLVGLRTIFGQIPAVAIYYWTGDLSIPLILGAIMFAFGAWCMIRLERRQRAGEQPPVETEPAPTGPEVI